MLSRISPNVVARGKNTFRLLEKGAGEEGGGEREKESVCVCALSGHTRSCRAFKIEASALNVACIPERIPIKRRYPSVRPSVRPYDPSSGYSRRRRHCHHVVSAAKLCGHPPHAGPANL